MDRFRPPPEDTFETSDEDEDGSVTNDEATEQPSTSDAKPTKRRY